MNHTVKIITVSLCMLSLGTTHSMELSKKVIGGAFIVLAILGGAQAPSPFNLSDHFSLFPAPSHSSNSANLSELVDLPTSSHDSGNFTTPPYSRSHSSHSANLSEEIGLPVRALDPQHLQLAQHVPVNITPPIQQLHPYENIHEVI